MPNLFGEEPAVQVSATEGATVDAALSSRVQQLLKDDGVHYRSMEFAEGNTLLIRFAATGVADQFKAQSLLKTQLGDNYSVALNLASATPHWMMAIGAEPMKLGLDLRGGVHFLLAVDVNSLLESRLRGELRNMREELRDSGIRSGIFLQKNPQKNGQILLQFRNAEDLDKATDLLKRRFPDFIFKVDGQQKSQFELTAQMTPASILQAQDYAIEKTTTILNNRINELGVAEPIVQRQGADRISVDLPGVQDTARAKQVLGGTATLEFHLVDVGHDASTGTAAGTLRYTYHGQPLLLEPRVILSGSAITGASSMVGENGGQAVSIRLGGGGESLFYRTTQENVGKPLAIIYVETKPTVQTVDGKEVFTSERSERVISVATIQSALGNNFQITGLADANMAQNLALSLRAGALPAPISTIEESTVGPSLGKDNINKGVFSVMVGLGVIVFFMLAYYRLFGLAADIALILNLLLLVALLSILGATLTLPAIAGIVLTLGMAVDANVLIFERIREELRVGVSPHGAIAAGFEKAFATIIDSNVTTLIAALALFALGSGAIKSFAVTLIIGLLTSMFTAITGTRAVIQLMYGGRNIKKLSIGI